MATDPWAAPDDWFERAAKRAAAPAATGPVVAGNPATGGGGGGGGTVNWQDLINNDPLYQQMKTGFGAESAADVASRNAAINRDFVRGGFDLSSLGDLPPELRSVVQQSSVTSAQNNPYSVASRIKQALQDSQVNNRVALRQRGAVRSGEQGYLAQKSQTAADTQRYDALNGLLDAFLGYNTQYVGAERARQQSLYAAMMAALQRQLAAHGDDSTGTPPTAAPPPAVAPPVAPPVSTGPQYTEQQKRLIAEQNQRNAASAYAAWLAKQKIQSGAGKGALAGLGL